MKIIGICLRNLLVDFVLRDANARSNIVDYIGRLTRIQLISLLGGYCWCETLRREEG